MVTLRLFITTQYATFCRLTELMPYWITSDGSGVIALVRSMGYKRRSSALATHCLALASQVSTAV